MVKGFPTVQHHFDSDADPAGWTRASYNRHPCDEIEAVGLEPNGYRAISLNFLKLMLAVDEYVTAAPDARLAIIAVAICLGWPSTRGLTLPEIAGQIGCSPSTLSRACTKFREMSGLDSAGGVRFIRPGAGSGANKPAAVTPA